MPNYYALHSIIKISCHIRILNNVIKFQWCCLYKKLLWFWYIINHVLDYDILWSKSVIWNRNFVYHSMDVDKILNYSKMDYRGPVKTVWRKNASWLIKYMKHQICVYFTLWHLSLTLEIIFIWRILRIILRKQFSTAKY